MLSDRDPSAPNGPASRRSLLRRLWRARTGATAIEYAMIGAILSAAILAAVTSLGGDLGSVFDTTVTALQDALP